MAQRSRSLIDCINDISVEDLEYVERDLCYYELVSLGFLLYGRERSHSEFILQKLIVLSNNPPRGRGYLVATNGAALAGSDVLRKYATINGTSWRVNLVEALAIIKAKKVLRKLGFRWQELKDHYLPHIPELSIHIHPILKALYTVCERLTIAQTERLVININAMTLPQESKNFRFFDYSQLEIFLLYWMTQRVIKIGDQNQLEGLDLEVLTSYLKLNEMEAIKGILTDTINHNTHYVAPMPVVSAEVRHVERVSDINQMNKDSGAIMESSLELSLSSDLPQVYDSPKATDGNDTSEHYSIRRRHAGFIVIINQSEFYEDTKPENKNVLPKQKFNKYRTGTDLDRDKLKMLFESFGYTPLVYNNLTHLEMYREIREAVNKSLLWDSLIVCILSHGMEGVVYGCNSVPVSINAIRALMTADTLTGKPKILIIQACQKNVAPVDTSVSNSEGSFQPDSYADMFVAMSSVPGTEAIRDTQTGSWFIASLCKQIEDWCKSKHLMDILTKVIADVTQKHGGESDFMLPSHHSTLRKNLYLPPRS